MRVAKVKDINSPLAPNGSNSPKERILIVDDSATVRHAFTHQFSLRYACKQAGSFMEALECLRSEEFDVVISDIRMPGISGVELLRRIVEKYPDTSVIMVSALNRPQVVLDTMREGAFDYLIKPCDPYLLDLTVERALERRALLRDAARYKADLEKRNLELADGKAQLQRLQAQIVQNAKMASLGQLAAGVAHELNNPTGFVLGNLEMLSSSIDSLLALVRPGENIGDRPEAHVSENDYLLRVADLQSMISDCREGADRIRDIVQNLRTFSRLDEAEFKDLDIHEGIDSTLRILSRYFTSDRISLIKDYGDISPIEGYSGQLNQVWMNLLANAAQALGPLGGEVRVTTRMRGGSVEVSISDSGPGISAEHLAHIFDPFYTTKPVGEGTGLGLSISYGVVQRHSGRIEVQTEIGSGTTFTVSLPTKAGVSDFPALDAHAPTQILKKERNYEKENIGC